MPVNKKYKLDIKSANRNLNLNFILLRRRKD